jgi:O-acetyl-ADP-ribose deacetylase (regulator of RNase III)
MENALSEMESMCRCHGINKVAMPIIGCGLDRLQWNKVSEIIKDIFKDTDIEILVCRQ